jgi:hypothetical protein
MVFVLKFYDGEVLLNLIEGKGYGPIPLNFEKNLKFFEILFHYFLF